MLGKNNPQIDIFTHMIFERLIPKDHLLVLINSIIDFSFVYDMVKDIVRGTRGQVPCPYFVFLLYVDLR